MEKQLERIRQKDYSALDNKLLQNLNKADNLEITLTHLSEFQHFLIAQISSLNNSEDKNKKTAIIQSTITKNIQTLKQSIVRCSNIKQKKRIDLKQIQRQVKQAKKQIQIIKNQMYYKLRQAAKATKSLAENALNELKSKLQQKQLQLAETKGNYQAAKSEILKLKEQNQLLKQHQIVPKSSQFIFNTQQSRQNSKNALLIENASVNSFHERNFSQNILLPLVDKNEITTFTKSPSPHRLIYGRSDKKSSSILEQKGNLQNIVAFKIDEKYEQNIKRQHSNHSLSRKDKWGIIDKQNQLIKAKGVTDINNSKDRRQSKQKLKVFSNL